MKTAAILLFISILVLPSMGAWKQELPFPDGTLINAAIEIQGGVVAVGADDKQGDFDAAVWTSGNGSLWLRERHIERVFGGPGDQQMLDIAVKIITSFVPPDGGITGDTGDTGIVKNGGNDLINNKPGLMVRSSILLIAVGFSDKEGDIDGAVWIASRPYTASGNPAHFSGWVRIPAPELGGPGSQVINAVAVSDEGIAAVGYEDLNGHKRAAAWTSVDGRQWIRVRNDPDLNSSNAESMADITEIAPSKFMAVGTAELPDGHSRPAIWVCDSNDWIRLECSGRAFGFEPLSDNSVIGVGLTAINHLNGMIYVGGYKHFRLPYPGHPHIFNGKVWFTKDSATAWSSIENSSLEREPVNCITRFCPDPEKKLYGVGYSGKVASMEPISRYIPFVPGVAYTGPSDFGDATIWTLRPNSGDCQTIPDSNQNAQVMTDCVLLLGQPLAVGYETGLRHRQGGSYGEVVKFTQGRIWRKISENP